jgi:Tfp pilus assembly protein PilO
MVQSGAERAKLVCAEMEELLQRLQKSASDCTALAQMNIKWQKKVEKAVKSRFPAAMREIAKYISLSSLPSSLSSSSAQWNLQTCSLHLAIDPVETICDCAQQIAAL